METHNKLFFTVFASIHDIPMNQIMTTQAALGCKFQWARFTRM